MAARTKQSDRSNHATAAVIAKVEMDRLVSAAVQGKHDALVALCQTIAKNVLFRVMSKVSNKSDAEDVAQEILLRVCEKIHSLREPKAFGGWLNRIIANEINRHMSKTAKQGVGLNIEDYMDCMTEEQEEFLPYECVIREDERRRVTQIVNKLPERQHEAIILFYYRGMGVSEAAKAMNVTKQSVSRYLALAREKIKNELKRLETNSEVSGCLSLIPTNSLLVNVCAQKNAGSAVGKGWADRAVEEWADRAVEGWADRVTEGRADQAAELFSKRIEKHIKKMKRLPEWASTVLVAAVIFLMVSAGARVLLTADAIKPEREPRAAGTVIFTGGDGELQHLNPRSAHVQSKCDEGELTALAWKISTSDGKELLGGEGGHVEETLAQLSDSGKDGDYVLVFSLKDAKGDSYTLSRTFSVRSGMKNGHEYMQDNSQSVSSENGKK